MVSRVEKLVAIALLGACATNDETGTIGGTTARSLVATLSGTPGWQHIRGDSNVTWQVGGGQFVASATITGDVAGAARPWHVHFGNCASGGGIVGDGYQSLVVDQSGNAASTATVDFELDGAAPYHVNVHESAAALTTIIACGDLAGRAGDGGDDTDPDTDEGGGGY